VRDPTCRTQEVRSRQWLCAAAPAAAKSQAAASVSPDAVTDRSNKPNLINIIHCVYSKSNPTQREKPLPNHLAHLLYSLILLPEPLGCGLQLLQLRRRCCSSGGGRAGRLLRCLQLSLELIDLLLQAGNTPAQQHRRHGEGESRCVKGCAGHFISTSAPG
jgi:hypothetical protein